MIQEQVSTVSTTINPIYGNCKLGLKFVRGCDKDLLLTLINKDTGAREGLLLTPNEYSLLVAFIQHANELGLAQLTSSSNEIQQDGKPILLNNGRI